MSTIGEERAFWDVPGVSLFFVLSRPVALWTISKNVSGTKAKHHLILCCARLPSAFVDTMKFTFGILEGVITEHHPLMRAVLENTLESIRSFVDCLHDIAFTVIKDTHAVHRTRTLLDDSESIMTAESLTRPLALDMIDGDPSRINYHTQEFRSALDQRLILTLSNCIYKKCYPSGTAKGFNKAFKFSSQQVSFDPQYHLLVTLRLGCIPYNKSSGLKTVSKNFQYSHAFFLLTTTLNPIL